MHESYQPNHEEHIEAPNVFQRVYDATNTVVTIPNALDVLAFPGAIYGIRNIETARGASAVLLSYGIDAIDGKIARKLGTASPLGEKIDAVGDKVKLGYGIYRLWKHDQADKPLLATVAIQNTINSVITIADRALNTEPVLHSSQIGKKSFMLQEIGVGLNIAGRVITKNGNEQAGEKLRIAGNIVGFGAVALGTIATRGYLRTLRQSQKK